MQDYLNIKEAAKKLGFSEGGLRRIASRGDIPCLRIGAGERPRYRFIPEQIEKWSHQQTRVSGFDPREWGKL